MLAQMRRSVTGSWARTFQKLFTQSVLRVAMMSSYTARTSADASAYSIGRRLTDIRLTSGDSRAPALDHAAMARRRRKVSTPACAASIVRDPALPAGCLSCGPQSAVVIAVEAIDEEPENRPDHEPDPGVGRQRHHQSEADQRAADAGEVRRRHAEAPRQLGPQAAQHQHADAD